MSATITTADAVINTLNKEQRAMLYAALLFYKSEAETNLAENMASSAMAPTLQQHIAAYLKWNLDGTKELMNQLFGNCFPEDLDLLKIYGEQKPLKEFIEKPAA